MITSQTADFQVATGDVIMHQLGNYLEPSVYYI